jgi:serine/threonine protein kinase
MHPQEMVGQTLGHYHVMRPLGHGGTATVFLAEDLNLQREVALKVFWPGENATHDFLRRVAREAHVLATLDHPHILPIYDYGEQDDTVYLVTPHMSGGSLHDRLRQQKIFPASETVALISQALTALQYAHDRDLVHRDIKPGNLLFKANGSLVISDFGLVKVVANEHTLKIDPSTANSSTQGIKGTPNYMAPEQILGKVALASDLYAIGVVLYEMLCGQRPFDGENYVQTLMKQLYETPRPLRAHNPHVSPALEAVVMCTLNKEPEQRYPSALALNQALVQAMQQTQPGFLAELIDYTTEPHESVHTTFPHTLRPQSSSWHSAETPREPALPPNSTRSTYSSTPAQSLASSPPQPIKPAIAALSQSAPIGSEPGKSRRKMPLFAILCLALLLVVLAASGGVLYTQGLPPFARAHSSVQVTPRPTVNQSSLLTASTDCPDATQSSRAALMPALPPSAVPAQNVVLLEDGGSIQQPGTSTMQRYAVTAPNQQPVPIFSLANSYILNGELSQNGQWLLFSAIVGKRYELRLVRIDGQGMQTLYCAPTQEPLNHLQWSFDYQEAIFTVGLDAPTIYMLDIATGVLHQALVPQGNVTYAPRFWLNNHYVYLTASLASTPNRPQGMYLLDISKGDHQHSSDLQPIVNDTPGCQDFDSDYASKLLITSSCNTAGSSADNPATGPSTITLQSALGASNIPQQIYQTTNAIVAVRGIAPNKIMYLVENSGSSSANGLWIINEDGSNPQQLVNAPNHGLSLCPFSQYSWSNVSFDGSMYAVNSYDPQHHSNYLYTGHLDQSQALPTTLAINNGTHAFVVGWTPN